MAKKNLHSLMSGIIGDKSAATEVTELKQDNSKKGKDIKDNTDSKPRPGRPKKNNDYTRTTLIISAELLRKLKYVSLMEDRTLTDLVQDAFSLYVSQWEKDNGPIRIPKK